MLKDLLKINLPGTGDYEAARMGWNLTVDQHPSIIIEVRTIEDVAHAINFAETNGLKIAVQSTGHGMVLPCNGQLLIKTAKLNRITLDAGRERVHIEAGALWSAVVGVTHPAGLAPLCGFAPTVGVVGYTLNGGFGWLVRKYGVAVDSVLSVDLVTMSGEVLNVSPFSDPELFWGLCGGGANLGIITAIELKLFPVKEVFAGKFLFPVERSQQVLEVYSQWSSGLPEELTSAIKIGRLPPDPRIPEAFRGKHMIVVAGCFLGSEERGLPLFGPIRALTPAHESLGMFRYDQLAGFNGDPADPKKLYVRVELLDELSPGLVKKLSDKILQDSVAQSLLFELRHVGDGVMAREQGSRSAFCHRQTRYILNVIAILPPEVDYATAAAEIQPLVAELSEYTTGKTFGNFLSYGDAADRICAAYTTEALERLLSLKAKFDPKNVLVSNLYDI